MKPCFSFAMARSLGIARRFAAVEKRTWLSKQFFDWMGILLAVSLLTLALTGEWSPSSWTALKTSASMVLTDSGGVPLIVIDAGHGGPDAGASSARGVKEAGINLSVAKLVESGLREAGFAVKMTRADENAIGESKREDMQARREIMRADGVQAVVSIHMNKFSDTSIRGPMAFYMKGSDQGEALATAVITAVCMKIDHPKRPANPGDYFVLRESTAPAVIIECGFLSNPTDEQLLQDPLHQRKLAEGIVAGIAAYFAGAPSAPTATPAATSIPDV